MKPEVSFQLLSIDIIDEYFPLSFSPQQVADLDKYGYDYSYYFEFDVYTAEEGFELMIVNMSFDLVNKQDDEEDPVPYVEIRNRFKVTKMKEKDYKIEILEKFFVITDANIQGIFAAKLAGTPMAAIIPRGIPKTNYHNGIVQTIEKMYGE